MYGRESRINYQITDADFEEYLEEFSESFLLSMLAEEVVETEDEEIIENLIGNSLFKIQCANIDITPVRKVFTKITQKIRNDISDSKRLKSFAANGFSIKSNISIEN